ncbi:MAG TPA: transposase [Acidobacteriaceae bacterium]|jgi:putative transposase|nr:transposase [Acidobacteriaceae bacterium]
MPWGLKRYQQARHLHFVTFSCHQRKTYLGSAAARCLFENSLETMRKRYGFSIAGYVVMPDHVHLLLSEPEKEPLAAALRAIKVSVTKQSRQRPFWQPRYYDFNVYTERKRVEKLRYMHRNPVKRGLVEKPEEWAWSSFQHYLTGEDGVVTLQPK